MTEQERQKKISASLKATADLLRQIAYHRQQLDDLSAEVEKRKNQCEIVAGWFDEGQFLPKEADATEPADPAPGPGETAPA